MDRLVVNDIEWRIIVAPALIMRISGRVLTFPAANRADYPEQKTSG